MSPQTSVNHWDSPVTVDLHSQVVGPSDKPEPTSLTPVGAPWIGNINREHSMFILWATVVVFLQTHKNSWQSRNYLHSQHPSQLQRPHGQVPVCIGCKHH